MDNAFLLEIERTQAMSCTRCSLCSSRTNVVFDEGSPFAKIMFIGEGPGREEDEQGRPFVGRSGKLLNKWIESMGLRRSDVYITNIVKCRPPNNRNPNPDEVKSCIGYLNQQIDIIKPSVIVTLGAVALKSLFQKESLGVTRQRGSWMEYQGIPVMPTYHPAYLLRQMSEENKSKVKSDLKQVMDKIR